MQEKKRRIEETLRQMREENLRRIARLTDSVSLQSYASFARAENGRLIWTDALQRALDEHETVCIPAAEQPYYIDRPIRVRSNRHIEADSGATVRLWEGVPLLMLRNEHTMDGTHRPIPEQGADENISINGGRWEEWHEKRKGYGKSGMYDEERSLFGVSTCLLFNHLDRLTLSNMVFACTAGFSVQVGNIKNAVFEHIRFEKCYADGLHINGNCENIWVRDVSGEVGDDLVALNMYDWQNSSVTFGPGRSILCEDVHAPAAGKYKSLRMEPGLYFYDDGSQVDCALNDVLIRRVSGVYTYKMYYQTPRYRLGEAPERGGVGSCSNLFFEDIDVDLLGPVDSMAEYLEGDSVRGAFGAFEIGANIDYISLEDVRLTLHRDRFPLSFLLVIGPKSVRRDDLEIFDPYVCCRVGHLRLAGVRINGEKMREAAEYVRVTRFDDINGDGHSSGFGVLEELEVLG